MPFGLLACPSRADMPIELELTNLDLEMSFGRLERDVSCSICRLAFRERLAEVLCGWDEVEVRLPRCQLCSQKLTLPFSIEEHINFECVALSVKKGASSSFQARAPLLIQMCTGDHCRKRNAISAVYCVYH